NDNTESLLLLSGVNKLSYDACHIGLPFQFPNVGSERFWSRTNLLIEKNLDAGTLGNRFAVLGSRAHRLYDNAITAQDVAAAEMNWSAPCGNPDSTNGIKPIARDDTYQVPSSN